MERDAALLIVDVQNDFCPCGALQVTDGDLVVEPVNRAIERFTAAGLPVLASRDWHPAVTRHFREYGGLWPVHCVRETPGAAFHPGLRLPPHAIVLSKGTDPDRDSYSAFDGTGLADRLRGTGVRRVWVGGLALDYCVLATALDSVKEGFETHLLLRAARPVDVTPGDGDRAVDRMVAAGVVIEH